MTADSKPVRRPPGPDAPVHLGIDVETLDTLRRLQRVYGNLAYVTTPNGRHAYCVNDPGAIQRVLVRDRDFYNKGPGFERVKLLLGNGIFVSDGEHWRRARTMIQPAFTRRHLHQLIGLITESCERRAEKWRTIADSEGQLDITKEMTDFALELILRAIFSDDYERRLLADGDNPFIFLSDESARDLELVVKFRALRKLMLEIVDERRMAGARERADFLTMYIDARDRSGEPFSDRDLLDELMTLIIAGFETSAGTLNWAWYLIALHEDVERRIVDEADTHISDAASVDKDSVAQLDYLQQVLNETMRMYPPGWIFSRRATEDRVLADYDVPAGTDIYISPYLLHRTEEYWPDPDTFDPDRFSDDRLSDVQQAAVLPFSLGPRRCIGEHFAMLEMKIHIGLLLQHFRMSPVDHEHPELDLGVNLRSKGGIRLRVERR